MKLFNLIRHIPGPTGRLARSWYWGVKARARLPIGFASAEDLLWLKVRALHRLGRTVEALGLARDALIQYPDRLDLRNFIVQQELEMAQRELGRGNAGQALAAVEAVVPRTPHQQRLATLVRSRALRSLGRHEEAVRVARAELDRWWSSTQPDIVAGRVHARNLVELANLAEAWRELLLIAKNSLRADPTHVEMLSQIAWALRKMRRIEQVERFVRHIVWRYRTGRMPLAYFVSAMRALDFRAPVLDYEAVIGASKDREAKLNYVELLIELSYVDRALQLMKKWRIGRSELSERNRAPLRRVEGPSPGPEPTAQFALEQQAVLRLRDYHFPPRAPLAPNGPTRVLMFASTIGVGGAERQLAYLFDTLSRDPSFDVTVVVFQKVKIETPMAARNNTNVVYVDDIVRQHDKASPSILSSPLLHDVQHILRRQKLRALLDWAAQLKPDVIYHSVGLPTDAIIIGHALRVPTVMVRFGGVTFRNNFNASDRQLQDQVVAEMCCHALAGQVSFVTNSVAARDAWCERLRVAPADFKVIPNGTPIQLDRSHLKDATKERLFGQSDVTVIGWVGRFHDVKRPQLWIEIALRLAADDPDLRFLLVGSGPLLSGLKKRVDATSFGNRFVFTGHVAEGLAELYQAMNILMVTSRTESFPNVVVEALAQGAYVVSAAVGGVPEIINGDLLGRLVASGDVDDFVAQVRKVLSDMPQIERERATRAQVIRNTYSLEMMVSCYAEKFRRNAGPLTPRQPHAVSASTEGSAAAN
jgi:glycosyltransferase involved in cell wall biosynthesis